MKLRNYFVILLLLVSSLLSFAADLKVSIIDVGQGDSICVETPGGKTVLIDAGDNKASSQVVNFLKSRKTKQIDLLILTHPHVDHYGGMPAVINIYNVGKYWDNNFFKSSNVSFQSLKALLSNKKISSENVMAGKYLEIGGAVFNVIAPSIADSVNPNNNSIIIRLTYGIRTFLLMGDAEKEERDTVNNWMTCDVLKVSHHGSSNGTDRKFINTIRPLAAVISFGLNNSYGHPATSVVSALSLTPTSKTATEGTITYSTDGKSLSIYKMGVNTVPTQVDKQGNVTNSDGSEVIVYITKSGESYHLKKCRYAKNTTSISLKDAIEQGYRACKVCKP